MSTRPSTRSGALILASLLTAVCAIVLAAGSLSGWRYERAAIAQGQWWRLASGQLMHTGWLHWGVNAAALGALATLFGAMGAARMATALTGSALAVAAGLWYAAPAVSWYVGLSGALHGLFAAGAVLCWSGAPRQERWGGALLWIAGVAKLCWEARTGWPMVPSGWLGTAVVTAAHTFGYVGGSFAGGAMAMGCRRRAPAPKGST